MTYKKPELLVLGDPVKVIQGSPKGPGIQDNLGHKPPTYSISAYEADE